jgi:hypothetical protein
LWKVGQWNTRVSLENRERELLQQGRLIPVQEHVPQPVPQQNSQQIVPIGYLHTTGIVPRG